MSTVQPTTTCKFVGLPSGIKLYTERWSTGVEAPSQTIVCIHGMGSTSSTFFPFIKPLLALLPNTHILLYDWAGSVPTTGSERTVQDFVGDFDALIAAEVPSGRISIVAHSAGTVLASRWLLTSSPAISRVTHVAYLGGPVNPPLPLEVTALQQGMAASIAAGGPSVVVDSVVPMLLGNTSVEERPLAVGMLRAITLSQSAEGYSAAIRAFSQDLSQQGERIDWETVQTKAKIMVVNGEEDAMMVHTDIASFLQKGLIVKVPRAGHTLTLEAPDDTAKIVADFFHAQ